MQLKYLKKNNNNNVGLCECVGQLLNRSMCGYRSRCECEGVLQKIGWVQEDAVTVVKMWCDEGVNEGVNCGSASFLINSTNRPGSPYRDQTFPKKEQRVLVYYVGNLADRKVFAFLRSLGKPFRLRIWHQEVSHGSEEVAQISVGPRSPSPLTDSHQSESLNPWHPLISPLITYVFTHIYMFTF